MKKLLSILLCASLCIGLSSCDNDNDNDYYVSVSGDGAITVDYDLPLYLYRMVLFSSEEGQELYLMGGSSFVNTDAEFGGRGASVMISMPNEDDNKGLVANSFDIDNQTYMVSYSPFINYYNTPLETDYVALSSGTVIIRNIGELFDIQILGKDSESNNIIISYRGYMYRSFYDEMGESGSDQEE